jgi:hypothetical protein
MECASPSSPAAPATAASTPIYVREIAHRRATRKRDIKGI